MAPPWKISAEEELEKNPKLKREDLMEIKRWIKEQPHLALTPIEDEIILHFLHATFYNVEAAKKTLDYFYYYKVTMPDFFSGWDPLQPDIQEMINEVLIAAPLPIPNNEGLRMIICKLDDNSKKFNYPLCVKWLLMTSMHAIWKLGIQPGFILVYDAAGFSLSHCFKCSLSQAKNYIDFGKNAAPMRVVKVVFINTSPVVEKMLTLVKPFLNKDLINMMSFHSKPDTFFKDLPKENVPEDYGGTLAPLSSLHRKYVEEVTENRDWLMKEEKIKCDKSKRGSPKKEKQKEKVESSLKGLEID
ncbi:uncharacterized protein LOC106663843 [Cimex lectularius]|uniref:CRAL-TRIO domain-containing protein n=1 Tax=Cimex lectularius TaxID=79782 RepID=A0A8I6RLT1_CIMLE|nr:uncharacterized protein LOC106663843 [Cimex lectularius]XP_014244484.1 uncharacterized protein LOC106663843 [Cimex lectularius]